MCVTAVVAAVAISAVSTVAAIDNANYQAKMHELQLEEQRKQLRLQQEGTALQSLEAQAERLREYRRLRALNMANMAKNTGMGQNIGFAAIEDDAKKRLRYDLTNIRAAAAGEKNRIFQDIRSTRYASSINKANKNAAVVGSLLNFASSAASAYQFQQQYATPNRSGTPPTSTGGGGGQYPAGWGR